ncbi:zinc finger protein 99-like [Erpetoichthys calabaricus]|uniref:zinc finger protein 99-like n=1 Tax=Erpetoichthys calabaricus TaxID=27687 RepID=UPI002234360A|nr:zinc finger protein 99-like [Erpetoichthys calabaricus]
MYEQQTHIKQEDCEWGALADLCVKSEEGRISVYKEEESKEKVFEIKVEDSEDFSVLQKHETGNVFRQEFCEESPSSFHPWFNNTGQMATQQNSVELKSELFESEEKINKGNETETEEQQSSRSFGKNSQKNGILSPSSFTQSYLQCSLQCKQDQEQLKKSASESENLMPSCLQFGSLPIIRLRRIKASSPNQQVEKDIIHTVAKLCCCSECGKQFFDSSALQKHTHIHTEKKPFGCSECGKQFSGSSALQKHTHIHTEEKPFSCSECGKRFSYPSSLQSHKRIHTGEKPYNCTECGKQFSENSALQKHTHIHTGEKLYCCSECGKRFLHPICLRKHSRIYTGEKTYPCSECVKGISDNRSFQQ